MKTAMANKEKRKIFTPNSSFLIPYSSLFFLFLFLAISLPAPAQDQAKPLSLDETLTSLNALSDIKKKIEFYWDPFMKEGVFSAEGHNAAFITGSQGQTGFLLIDGREFFTVPVPYFDGGELFFPAAFTGTAKTALKQYMEDEKSRFRIAAVIVDPGHGGKDAGAVGNFTINGKPFRSVEKDITLEVSKLLYTRLTEGYPDKRILLTRNGDTFPALPDRVAIANSVPLTENEAIVFISIHANSSFNKAARGYEVWYLSPEYRRDVIDPSKYAGSAEVIPILNAMMEEEFTTESIMMAQSILRRYGEAMGKIMPSRGVKAEEWFVVRNARMPSVLVELGFVSNEQDALLMADKEHLQKTAAALYNGIADFISVFEKSGGFTAIQ
jgi:N-acetylmuramoyl-L-alanine amidase